MEYPPMGITDKDNNQSCKTGMEESCNFGDESVAICGQMQCGNKLRHIVKVHRRLGGRSWVLAK